MNKQSTFIIAEAGVNHNGCLQQAYELVDIAVEAKVDAIKFQTFNAKKLVTPTADKANYQKTLTDPAETQYLMLKRLELSKKQYKELFHYCEQQKLPFISTPFDLESADFLLNELKLSTVKVSSGDITFGPLLLALSRSDCHIILSSGMTLLGDIESALSVIAYGMLHKTGFPTSEERLSILSNERTWELLKEKVTLLHCTSSYPAAAEHINLSAIETLRQAFGLSTGFSDHSTGIAIPIAAAALGASVIEKHFTIDKKLPGPDHKASLNPPELTKMVKAIREVNCAMGSRHKRLTHAEIDNVQCVRRSIILNAPINCGEFITEEHLSCMRPGMGISPMEYWDFIGKPANRTYQAGELLSIE